MISMYTHQCCSRSTLGIAGTLLALSYIFCVYRLGCWEKPPSPATGGGTIWLGEGGVWGSLLIYMCVCYQQDMGDPITSWVCYKVDDPLTLLLRLIKTGFPSKMNEPHEPLFACEYV